MDEGRNIMIIDDEADLCMLMKNYLQLRLYNVHYALTLTDGIEKLKTCRTVRVGAGPGRSWKSIRRCAFI